MGRSITCVLRLSDSDLSMAVWTGLEWPTWTLAVCEPLHWNYDGDFHRINEGATAPMRLRVASRPDHS